MENQITLISLLKAAWAEFLGNWRLMLAAIGFVGVVAVVLVLMYLYVDGEVAFAIFDVAVIVGGIIFALITALALRSSLTRAMPGSARNALWKDVLFVFILQLVIGLIAMIALIMVALGLAFLCFCIAMFISLVTGVRNPLDLLPGTDWASVLPLVGFIIAVPIYIWVQGRFQVAIAATVAARRIILMPTWDWTAGHGLRGSAMLLIAILASILIALALSLGIHVLVGIFVYDLGALEIIGAAVENVMTVIISVAVAASAMALWRRVAPEDHLAEVDWRSEASESPAEATATRTTS